MPDNDRVRLGAIILTGGRSVRMGRPKDSLPFAGTTLLGHVATTLSACASPVVVVARAPEQPLPPLPAACELVHDERPGEGPLAALATGLRALGGRADAALLAACDQPFWSAAAVRWLLAQLGTALLVMPHAHGVLQPLAAIYRADVLPAIDAALGSGQRTPRDLARLPGARTLVEAELRAFDPQLRFLQDVDTPQDYDAARARPGGER